MVSIHRNASGGVGQVKVCGFRRLLYCSLRASQGTTKRATVTSVCVCVRVYRGFVEIILGIFFGTPICKHWKFPDACNHVGQVLLALESSDTTVALSLLTISTVGRSPCGRESNVGFRLEAEAVITI